MSRIFEALRQSEWEAQQKLGENPLPIPSPALSPEVVFAPLTHSTTPISGVAAIPVEPAAQSLPGFNLNDIQSFTPEPAPHLVSLNDERGLGAEKFRVLATRLSNIRRRTNLKIVQVTSSILGEGKSLVSSNLAVTLAKRSGQSVLLIEGDLRRPALCPMFGLPADSEGIGGWWRHAEGGSILPWLRRASDSTFCLLPAGSVPHPVAVLQSGRMTDLVQQLAGWFDWVIVDTPPILPMADSNLWARLADGTLLVIREGVVSRHALRSAVDSMDSPKLVGLVLNDATDFDRLDYYGRAYSYEADPNSAAKSRAKGAN